MLYCVFCLVITLNVSCRGLNTSKLIFLVLFASYWFFVGGPSSSVTQV